MHDMDRLKIDLLEGKLASSTVSSITFDCIHNNDLVDYFKTLFEGNLSMEIEEFNICAQIEIYHLLR